MTQALLQYTNLDPTSDDGRHVLMTYCLAQSYPDIKAKFKKLEQGPATPQTEILSVAFNVFHNQEEEKECRKQRADQPNFQMLARILKHTPGHSPATSNPKPPPGTCFKCGKEGHWSEATPSPRQPTTPYPKCQKRGYWGSNCPFVPRGGWSSGPQASRTQQPSMVGLADED